MRPVFALALFAVAFARHARPHAARNAVRAATGAAVTLAPCQGALQWSVNNGNIGVIAISGIGCLNNAGAGPALTLETCVGGDQNEIGYNLTATSVGAVEWASSGLCLAAVASSVTLAPCAAASVLSLSFNASTAAIHVNSSTCLSLAPPMFTSVYGSHMVLSAGKPVTFRGYAEAGAMVNVSLPTAWATATVSAAGMWNATLPPQAIGGPANVTAVQVGGSRAGTTQTLSDVMFGVVLGALGQSNMAGENTPVAYIVNGSAEIAGAGAFPYVRVMQVGTSGSGASSPQYDLGAAPSIPWSVASSSSIPDLSGLAWLTGKHIAQALGPEVPIGIMESAWGGTSIQVWMSAAALTACGTTPPSYPGGWPTTPGVLYNGQVAPFTSLAVDGFIWMQGESNALDAQAYYYDCALPGMINDWRQTFPYSAGAYFGVAQLAPWASSGASANEMTAELRESQLKSVAGMPNVTTATAVDGGDPYAPNGSIHAGQAGAGGAAGQRHAAHPVRAE